MTDQMDDAAYAEYLDRAEDAASDEYWLAGIRESRRREARLAASEKREAALGSVCLAMIFGVIPIPNCGGDCEDAECPCDAGVDWYKQHFLAQAEQATKEATP